MQSSCIGRFGSILLCSKAFCRFLSRTSPSFYPFSFLHPLFLVQRGIWLPILVLHTSLFHGFELKGKHYLANSVLSHQRLVQISLFLLFLIQLLCPNSTSLYLIQRGYTRLANSVLSLQRFVQGPPHCFFHGPSKCRHGLGKACARMCMFVCVCVCCNE